MSIEGVAKQVAIQNLGMGTLPYDKHRVHKNCDILIDCAKENEETEKISIYLASKAALLDDIAENQLQKR